MYLTQDIKYRGKDYKFIFSVLKLFFDISDKMEISTKRQISLVF